MFSKEKIKKEIIFYTKCIENVKADLKAIENNTYSSCDSYNSVFVALYGVEAVKQDMLHNLEVYSEYVTYFTNLLENL